MLVYLDVDQPGASAEALPSWWLGEVDPSGALTGRPVQGLYEELLTSDPSGHEGQDLDS
jgi:hypothetical protein